VQELLALAAEQFGLFTRDQAHKYQLTDRMLQRRVRNGTLEQLPRGVYRVVGVEKSWRHLILAACFCGGDDCVASHRTAAVLHGFDSVRSGIVEVTVPRTMRYKCDWATVHQSGDLTAVDRTMIGLIPVTTPERTLIDLGAVRHWRRVEESFDGAERDDLTTTDLVHDRHAQLRKQGRNGVGPMAVVLAGRTGVPPKEVIERRFLRLLEAAHLPKPECQYEVVLPDGRRRFIDAALVDLKLGFELDGHATHSTRKQRAADYVRTDELGDLGWRISRFTWEEIHTNGALVVHRVRSAIAARFGGL
jgi:hypothetical protein